jgi:ATP synthase subunit 6
MLIPFLLFVFYFTTNNKDGNMVPGRYQSVLEIVYGTIQELVKNNIPDGHARFFPFIFSLFMFLAIINLIGLVPYTFTPTSHGAVSFGLSFSIFIACVAMGFINHQIEYFSMFMPNGAPMVLGPILIVIELVSHFNKALSLGLRLAANITAGHLLFAILSSFA